MKANENGIDRVIRFVLGAAVLTGAFLMFDIMSGNITGIIAGVIGAVLVLTGLVGFCPAYRLVGLSTCKKDCCGSSCSCGTTAD